MSAGYGGWAARWRVPLGFAFALAFLILSRPTRGWLIGGGVVALAGLLLRGISAGYIQKNESLATAGPFRYTRNPLYLGSFILGAGFVAAAASAALAIAFIVLFVLIYVPVMRREKAYLQHRFGEEYDRYARQTPLFFPVPGRGASGEAKFQWKQYWKNREYEAAAGWAAILLFLIIKLMLR
ncbi:MAG: methyltransferase family protein [Terriglobia bacterium]